MQFISVLKQHQLLIATFVAGCLLGAVGMRLYPHKDVPTELSTSNGSPTEQRGISGTFKFINPLLSCGVETDFTSTKEIRDLRTTVIGMIDDLKSDGTITEAGIYFRELNDGSWFGIDENIQFTPGSLLKVPLAMSILQKVSSDPAFGTHDISYNGGALEIAQSFPPEKTVEKGKSYTLEQLLEYSIVYSDNIATQILSQLIERSELNASYSNLGIDAPPDGDVYTMSVRTYASFFRILFNGTYLSHEASEYLLSLLARSTFTQGLVAGLPEGTVVAHKFGERERSGQDLSQLHDCGIVYTPKHPYVLCVMLRGKDMKQLPKVIADISRIVYEKSVSNPL